MCGSWYAAEVVPEAGTGNRAVPCRASRYGSRRGESASRAGDAEI
jgi:hypothetical protein